MHFKFSASIYRMCMYVHVCAYTYMVSWNIYDSFSPWLITESFLFHTQWLGWNGLFPYFHFLARLCLYWSDDSSQAKFISINDQLPPTVASYCKTGLNSPCMACQSWGDWGSASCSPGGPQWREGPAVWSTGAERGKGLHWLMLSFPKLHSQVPQCPGYLCTVPVIPFKIHEHPLNKAHIL